MKKRQTTLPAYNKKQIRRNLSKKNSNVFIAAKEENKPTPSKELSRLSDALLKDLTELNNKIKKDGKTPFTITSATGNAEWELEPTFMLTNVPKEFMKEIHLLSKKYKQNSVAVSNKNESGASFVTPEGKITAEFKDMVFDNNAIYSTDYPTGQRLTFIEKQDTFISERIFVEREGWFDLVKARKNKIRMSNKKITKGMWKGLIKVIRDDNDLMGENQKFFRYSNLGKINKNMVDMYLNIGLKFPERRYKCLLGIQDEMLRSSTERYDVEDQSRGGK